ncbi:hypothetical protein F2Q68_00034458 [Brassica cretica]|uniref:Uncharacterized protein n=2 Tax=Brassica cretica TaxID=69181 RepID=A0A3N6SP57_BRACR|nr:hypothetical protein F2Q68_00034458 [Brassica cretica]KAF3485339.1 hypothetical protein F2Q69_00053251 [Brassica cretica]KAF3591210.1 hypothetical protein DY000_02022273 [Brassica cretica]
MGSLWSSGDSIGGYTRMHGLMSYRRFGRARSLCSDRASAQARSLRSDQTNARAWSLRSDRAEHVFGRCIAIFFELLSDDSRFLRKAFRKEESISKKCLSKKVHAYQKQQGNPTAIFTRSCKFGTLDLQGSALLMDRQQHFCVARFCSITVDPDTSPVDRFSLNPVDRQHKPFVDRHHPPDIDRHSISDID